MTKIQNPKREYDLEERSFQFYVSVIEYCNLRFTLRLSSGWWACRTIWNLLARRLSGGVLGIWDLRLRAFYDLSQSEQSQRRILVWNLLKNERRTSNTQRRMKKQIKNTECFLFDQAGASLTAAVLNPESRTLNTEHWYMIYWQDMVRFIRTISRLHLDSGHQQFIFEFCRQDVPWEQLILLAESEGVDGLLYHHLNHFDGIKIPEPAMCCLAKRYEEHRRNQAAIITQVPDTN